MLRLIASCVLIAFYTLALAQTPGAGFKKNYNYSEWTKGRFSEVVTVTGPGKMIFLAGVGASEAAKGWFHSASKRLPAQCRYAYEKIRKLLAQHGARHGRCREADFICDGYPLARRSEQVPVRSVHWRCAPRAYISRDQPACASRHAGRDGCNRRCCKVLPAIELVFDR